MRACVHIYVGVCCLSTRYLARSVSSHVQSCASLLNTYYTPSVLFVYATVLVCVVFLLLFGEALSVLYLILISWLDESGVQRVQGFRIIQNYIVLLNHRGSNWV